MSHSARDHQYTVALAEKALRLIKAHLLPGDPPSFEIWYTYAGRFIPALNQAINDALAARGTLSAVEIDRIYDRHLGTFRLGERIDKIGESVGGELDSALGAIDAAVGSAARYEKMLSDLREQMARPIDPPALHAILDALVRETRTVAHDSRGYKANLEIARAEIARLRSDLEAIRFESRTDGLTALANRKQFDQCLSDEIVRATKTCSPLTLLLCDVDHFKAFNDTWGHPLGDDVLRLIARSIKEVVSQSDIAARYGGEEFALILPHTDVERARRIAERLRTAVNSKEIVQRSTGKRLGRITVSAGLAQWRPGESMRELVERADACLYAAKRQGRNQVVWQLPAEHAEPSRIDAA